MRSQTSLLLLVGCLALAPIGATLFSIPRAQDTKLINQFYAFNNSMRGEGPSDPAKKAALLAELGFDGFEGYDLHKLPELAGELHKRKLEVSTIYFKVDIDSETNPYDKRIAKYLETFLKDTGVILTVHLHSKTFSSSDAAGDEYAVPILVELSDLAHTNGAKVAVYNHVSFWAESIDDGIRLAKKVNRRNFGAAFNLCHWLSLEGDVNLTGRLDEIAPYLLSVTLCGAKGGADAKGAGWNELIQPLGKGSFDNLTFLREVIKRGYRGPIGLQCYNISLPAREHLTRSIGTWRAFEQNFLEKDQGDK
jgi:sugar phosphate isomerase/epimerase